MDRAISACSCLGAACAVGQFLIGFWLSSLRPQMGRPVDELAADDPLRIQFNHAASVFRVDLVDGMVAALIAFLYHFEPQIRRNSR